MAWGFYDESGEYDSGGNLLYMTMGGCMSPLDKWRLFEPAWKEPLAAEGLESRRVHIIWFRGEPDGNFGHQAS
jgi:hypothetical protein